MANTIDILKNRVSLRRYKDEDIKREHLDMILESAMRAPTAGNMMLYSIIVVNDENKKKALSRTCDNQPFIAKAPLVMIFAADYQKWFDYYIMSGVEDYCRERNMEFNGPKESELLLASCDTLIAAQNAVVAAESLGIGSCYIGDIMENYETHKELLNLPDFVFPVAMLCMGYYPDDEKRIIKSRYAKEYVVFDDEYKKLSQDDLKDMFKDLEARFVGNNKFNAANMGQFHYAMKTGADFSKEMERSVREALKNWSGIKI